MKIFRTKNYYEEISAAQVVLNLMDNVIRKGKYKIRMNEISYNRN